MTIFIKTYIFVKVREAKGSEGEGREGKGREGKGGREEGRKGGREEGRLMSGSLFQCIRIDLADWALSNDESKFIEA